MVMEKKDEEESTYLKGVRNLCESGTKKLPRKYILPVPERPLQSKSPSARFKLPTIDFSQLQDSNGRPHALRSLSRACQEYGFFQIVNHGIPSESLLSLLSSARRFFELSCEEREKYMSNDIRAPVRYGTSFNQLQDGVFFWRDFLKLSCHPLLTFLPFWPSSPPQLREEAMSYAKQSKALFLVLMEAILETLGIGLSVLKELKEGTHMMVINCFPPCPEPDLTLGMPPHSDYGFLTILLQDKVKGLQVQCGDDWITVDPVANSLFVNVGDHLEIFSNGRYKSVLHRVLVNSSKSRNSIASVHSLPFDSIVRPSPELVKENQRLYKDTDFASFLNYMTTHETNQKHFLESRKVANMSPDSQ
ncbi:LOW QUALITY PROTEIN: protein DMR6-LIKE OXYGENASE 2-like [Phalaenopsis equestris]|uniref:LOW QUALITY PROTEIN: protein DMR6-LIKE OXYGENASE 2-like n=1 Tax=Phalaenopsis equestris TaxID=78828 RepID=UPI0009E5FED6|nr:LOW QUALITY PROTEIN: protein DMR6-LIKE OXYGENASE 2-like [Phalaenopsis equestris]